MCSVTNDAVPAEVDETQSHMQPVVEKQEHDDVRCVIFMLYSNIHNFCRSLLTGHVFGTVSLIS